VSNDDEYGRLKIWCKVVEMKNGTRKRGDENDGKKR
jgi:hypothetical protein